MARFAAVFALLVRYGCALAAGEAGVVEQWPRLELIPEVGHEDTVRAVAFSPDGRWLASGSDDNTARIWEATTGRLVRVLEGHFGDVMSVAFSGDGRRLVTGSTDRTVRVWEVATGHCLQTLTGPADNVLSVSLSPDGRALAAGSADQRIWVWEVPSGRLRKLIEGHKGGVTCIAFSPGGKYLASGSTDSTVRLWDPDTGRTVRAFPPHEYSVSCLSFSPDSRLLATGSEDNVIRVRDVATGQDRAVIRGQGTVWDVVFSPDGRSLACAIGRDPLTLRDPLTGEILQLLPGEGVGAFSLSFSPDGRQLACGGPDRGIRVLDTTTAATLVEISGQQEHGGGLDLSPDGQYLASGSYFGHSVNVWSLADGYLVRALGTEETGNSVVCFSPDSKVLAAAGFDSKVRLWEVSTGRLLDALEGHKSFLTALAFSADGSLLASGGDDKTIRLWRVTDGRGQCVRVLTGHEWGIWDVAFSPDGRCLASGSNDDTVRLWDVSTGRLLHTLKQDRGSILAVAFSPDGRQLAYSAQDEAVHIWDVATAAEVRVIRLNSGNVTWIRYSGDGRSLTLATFSGSLMVRDAATGALTQTVTGWPPGASEIAMSRDGRRAVARGFGGTAELWDGKTWTRLASFRDLPQGNWITWTPQNYYVASPGAERYSAWRLRRGPDDPGQVVSLDQYRQNLWKPDMVRCSLGGQEPLRPPVVTAAAALSHRPPEVQITSPASGARVESTEVEIAVRITSPGGDPVRKVTVQVNGRPTALRDVQVVVAGEWRRTVGLERGRNIIGVIAETDYAANRVEDSQITVVCEPKDRDVEVGPQKANCYVLAVGLSQYANPAYNLHCGAGDAEAVAEGLKRLGEGGAYGQVETRVLTDGRATRTEIIHGLEWLRAKAKQGDLAVVFMAGHGVRSEGFYYFVPHEGQADDLAATSVSWASIGEQLARTPSRLLVLLDTCHAAALGRPLGFLYSCADLNDLLRNLGSSDVGAWVMAAAAAGEAAFEDPRLSHGYFTQALLEGLGGQADLNKDGGVWEHELQAYLTERVKELSHGAQNVVVSNPLGRPSGLVARK